MGMANVMKERRRALGMSQARLAELAGINVRQIVRYEAGEQQPLVGVAAAIARALGMSLSDLAAEFDPVVDLSGSWWAGWGPDSDGQPTVSVQELQIIQQNTTLHLYADTTAVADEDGIGWQGEARLWDNEVLLGTYRGADEGQRSRGTLLLVLEPELTAAHGRWVGQRPDGSVDGGPAMLARDRDRIIGMTPGRSAG